MKKIPILLVILTLLGAMLACTMNIGGPSMPSRTIPVSTEAIGSLQQQIEQAAQAAAQTGQMTLVITEEQITSLLAQKLSEQQEPLITNPQVYLDDGTIQVYGKAQQGMFEATVGIIVTASVDANGQPLIQITSADFGPIPVPDGLNESIAALVKEAYTGSLGPAATGFRLESILVDNGLITMTGRTK